MSGLVSVPKGQISVSTQIQADWKPDSQAAAFKICTYTQYCGTAITDFADC